MVRSTIRRFRSAALIDLNLLVLGSRTTATRSPLFSTWNAEIGSSRLLRRGGDGGGLPPFHPQQQQHHRTPLPLGPVQSHGDRRGGATGLARAAPRRLWRHIRTCRVDCLSCRRGLGRLLWQWDELVHSTIEGMARIGPVQGMELVERVLVHTVERPV